MTRYLFNSLIDKYLKKGRDDKSENLVLVQLNDRLFRLHSNIFYPLYYTHPTLVT